MRALIVDPTNGRGGLAAVRAMARAGWMVGVAGTDRNALAASSRRATWWDPVPRPTPDVERFVDAVARAVRHRGYDVLLPAGDEEALALSRERSRIPAHVPYASHDAVVRAFDKLSLQHAATSVGVRTPVTSVVRRGAPLPAFELPVIVKERLHSGTQGNGSVRVEASIARTADALAGCVSDVHRANADALVQEVVSGRLIAHSSVTARDGTLLAEVQQEADRVFPPGTGASARAHTVPVDTRLTECAARLLRELRWWGLAELQFLQQGDGEPCLIDFNGRLYGSLALAVAATANLPALWAGVATGRPTGAPGVARPGVCFQWFEGDVRVATHGRRGAPAIGALVGCMGHALRARHGIWSPADPMPQLRDAARLVRQEAVNVPRLARKLAGSSAHGSTAP